MNRERILNYNFNALTSAKMTIFWTGIFFLSLVHTAVQQTNEAELALREKLLANRNVAFLTRPVQNWTDKINVEAYPQVNHILELDEARGILTINGWMFMHWVDLSLTWDGVETNIYFIRLPSEVVWKPTIYLMNNAEASRHNTFGESHVLVSYDGNVFWVPSLTTSTACDLDFKWFPMDEHICDLVYTSWISSGGVVNLTLGNPYDILIGLTSAFFDEHNQWELIYSEATWQRFYLADYFLPHLQFRLHLRRRAPFYHLTFVVPNIVALMLTLATFWFPASSTERLSLACITNVMLTLMLMHLYWVIPRSGSSIPGIVVLCGNMAFFSGLSLVLAIVSLTLSRTNATNTVPSFLHNLITGWLGIALCLRIANTKDDTLKADTGEGNLEANEEKSQENHQKRQFNEWIVVATVFDRLCFLIYCLSYFIILLIAFV